MPSIPSPHHGARFLLAALLTLPVTSLAHAQKVIPAEDQDIARHAGAIKTITPQGFVIASIAGSDLNILFTLKTKVSVNVAPTDGTPPHPARPGTIQDLYPGDRVLIEGTQKGPDVTAITVTLTIPQDRPARPKSKH